MNTKLEAIHNASMAILQNTGCLFHHPEVVEKLKSHGLKVDGSHVYFTEKQVMEQVAKAPSSFTLRAPNAEKSITVGGSESHFCPGAGAPLVVDDDGSVREATLADFKEFVKMFQASPIVSLISSAILTPTDIPPHASALVATYNLMLMSDKPFWFLNGKGSINNQTLSLLEILYGEAPAFGKDPMALTIANPLSPLSFDHQALSALQDFGSRGQGVIIAPAAMAGTTAPMTLAGTIALTNAETLAGITVSQILNPGAPVVYGFQSTTSDVRTGAIAIGSPEQAICATYGANLARFYELPSRGGGAITDASGPGLQSSYEAMMTLLATRQAGMNLIVHTAGILGGFAAISLNQSVIGLEVVTMVDRFMNDITTDEQNLALDVIDQVGPGGQFLNHKHTMKNCRKGVFVPRLGHRGTLEGPGYLEAEAARLKAERERLIGSWQAPDLGESVRNDLKKYMEKESLI